MELITSKGSSGTITLPSNKSTVIIVFSRFSATAIHSFLNNVATQYAASFTQEDFSIWSHNIKFIQQSSNSRTFNWNAWFSRYTCTSLGTSPMFDAGDAADVSSIVAF